MKINNIKVNAYGNIENKDINLDDGINIIYGENESGKSTLLSYITNILYGISRTKDGKELSDFEKYKPWNSEDFSGKIAYTLDNGEKYEIVRKFNSKKPKIYNNNLEEISDSFDMDKKDGSKFFVEQTGVDKQMYLSTVVAMQQEVRLNEKNQNILVQKIANLAGTGEDNISYKNAMEKLQEKIRDEIGTTKTSQKPINIAQDELAKIQEELQKLQPYTDKKYELENEKETVKEKIQQIEEQIKVVEELKKINNSEIEQEQKINILKNSEEQNKQKLENLQKEKEKYETNKNDAILNLEKLEKEQQIKEQKLKDLENKQNEQTTQSNIDSQNSGVSSKKNNNIGLIIMAVILLIAIIASILTLHNNILTAIFAILEAATVVDFIIKKNKQKKEYKQIEEKIIAEQNENKEKITQIEQEKNEVTSQIAEIEQQIKTITEQKNEALSQESMVKGQIILLEKNNETILAELVELQSNIEQKLNLKEEELRKQYKYKIDENILNELLDRPNINQLKIELDKTLNELKVKLKAIEIEENTIIPHLDNMVVLKEKEELYTQNYKELKEKENIINLAMQNLTQAYEEMKTTITPKFTQSLSSSISKITKNKYNKVTINNENAIIIENDKGEYIEADKLSTGTIDQLYFSLRLSMIDDLSKEKLPVMLDETFAYFDNNRLEQALKYLSEELGEHQALIFTCSNREMEIFKKLNIKYNLVTL
ncbi:MAG: ATP-binding protein [Clostridia bacterium]